MRIFFTSRVVRSDSARGGRSRTGDYTGAGDTCYPALPGSRPIVGRSAGLRINRDSIVEKDPKLRFVLTEKSYPVPAAGADLSENERLVLLGAYMVGNLRSCLGRETTDDP